MIASSRPIAMALVALLALGLTATLVATSAAQQGQTPFETPEIPEQPEQMVMRGPPMKCGPIEVYIHSFPYSFEWSQIEYWSPIFIGLSVWGASHEDPVLVYCDGREVAAIEEPGYYMILLDLPRGYHHVAITCRYGIFVSSTFYVKPPEAKPAEETIPLSDVQAMLEALRREVWRNCLIAAVVGLFAGYGLKRASKIEFRQLYVPFVVPIGLGLAPQTFSALYWLVPFGLTAILAYHFVRDFAEWRGYMYFEPNRVAGDVFPLWGEQYIAGLRPVKDILLGRGLLLYKRFIVREAATIEFEFAGEVYVLYVLRSQEDVQETEDAFILRCSKHLAKALARADILKVVDKELSELRLEVMAYREMVKTAAFRVVSIIDDFFATSPLDRVTFLNVDEIREQLKARVMRELGQLPQAQVQAATPVAPQARGGEVKHGQESH